MLKVTQEAAQEMKKVLQSKRIPRGSCLRLAKKSTQGLGFYVDIERPDDQVVFCGETKVLVLSDELSSVLKGVVMDVEATKKGFHFSLREVKG